MVYTEATERAMRIAYNAHHGQLDKSGVPYIFHPIHLAEKMGTEAECIVALLHDTVEDTDVTLDELSEQFPSNVIEALKLLTHDKSVDYFDYVRMVKDNPIARKVKLADLRHNSDMTRIKNPTEKDWRRAKKYQKAIEILDGEE